MERALFIFRRDLRLEDNTGLIFALKSAKEVIPAFIFTPEQIDKNSYRSDRALQFMIESLEDLQEQLEAKKGRLYLFHDHFEKVVELCIEKEKVDLVVVNRDYTPYSLKRDQKIEQICKRKKVPFHSFDDLLLHGPEEVLKADKTPYSVFTPYYRAAQKVAIKDPVPNRSNNYFKGLIPFAVDSKVYHKILPTRFEQQKGGRKAAGSLLKKKFPHYVTLRDFPAKEGTSHLSAHLKFTTYSPREIYKALHPYPALCRSLFWRDFFSSIGYFFPRVFKGAFREKYDEIEWSYDKKDFNRWCDGKTGFPIVDAGMRELNETGYMHNRVRMVVASFLVKDLHIDWRWGEKYFAQHLIDYDPAVNNGNWQWSASTGCDAQPYFRIFNPWNQQEKFDPDCEYIKLWIPELSKVDPRDIHKWFDEKNRRKVSYPEPMVDHSKESKVALKAFKAL